MNAGEIAVALQAAGGAMFNKTVDAAAGKLRGLGAAADATEDKLGGMWGAAKKKLSEFESSVNGLARDIDVVGGKGSAAFAKMAGDISGVAGMMAVGSGFGLALVGVVGLIGKLEGVASASAAELRLMSPALIGLASSIQQVKRDLGGLFEIDWNKTWETIASGTKTAIGWALTGFEKLTQTYTGLKLLMADYAATVGHLPDDEKQKLFNDALGETAKILESIGRAQGNLETGVPYYLQADVELAPKVLTIKPEKIHIDMSAEPKIIGRMMMRLESGNDRELYARGGAGPGDELGRRVGAGELGSAPFMHLPEEKKKAAKPASNDDAMVGLIAGAIGVDISALTNATSGMAFAAAGFTFALDFTKGVIDRFAAGVGEAMQSIGEGIKNFVTGIGDKTFGDSRLKEAVGAGGGVFGPLFAGAMGLGGAFIMLHSATVPVGIAFAALGTAMAIGGGLALMMFTLTTQTKSYAEFQRHLTEGVSLVVTALEPFWMNLIPTALALRLLMGASADLMTIFADNEAVGRALFDVTKNVAMGLIRFEIALIGIHNGMMEFLEKITFAQEGSKGRMSSDKATSNLNELGRTTFENSRHIDELGDESLKAAEALRELQSSTFNLPAGMRVSMLRSEAEDPTAPYGSGGPISGDGIGHERGSVTVNVYTNDPQAAADAVVAAMQEYNFLRTGRPGIPGAPNPWPGRG